MSPLPRRRTLASFGKPPSPSPVRPTLASFGKPPSPLTWIVARSEGSGGKVRVNAKSAGGSARNVRSSSVSSRSSVFLSAAAKVSAAMANSSGEEKPGQSEG